MAFQAPVRWTGILKRVGRQPAWRRVVAARPVACLVPQSERHQARSPAKAEVQPRQMGFWVALTVTPLRGRGCPRQNRCVSTSLAASPLTPADARAPSRFPEDLLRSLMRRPDMRPRVSPACQSVPHLDSLNDLLRRSLWRKEDAVVDRTTVNEGSSDANDLQLVLNDHLSTL